jgi:hypothetical protein
MWRQQPLNGLGKYADPSTSNFPRTFGVDKIFERSITWRPI